MEWWGYSPDYGWVFLDRTIKSNQPGQSDNLIFIICKTSEVIQIKREYWKPPAFVYEKRFLEKVDSSRLSFEQKELSSYKIKTDLFREAARSFLRKNSKSKDPKLMDPPSIINTIKNKLAKVITFTMTCFGLLIPIFIIVLIINQMLYGNCFSGYCLSAAFPRVFIISIAASLFFTFLMNDS
ncbi:hypothetical protein [Pseudoalteromonas sp. ESRF-bin5]|uniref:hypothetical protein n=1 Tax=Pseudoalteromonas sp. ESRF-bin5 TaxID=2014532 RepID=UPI00257F8C90|nr:hypothetical protein [Pseudoalteromonas sp. ESRF-bin5]